MDEALMVVAVQMKRSASLHAVFLVMAFSFQSVFAAETNSTLSAQFARESLVISDREQNVLLPDIIGKNSISRIVHAVQKRDGDYYILIGAKFWSRFASHGGYCGSGMESHIQWLHIHEGEVVETTKRLYDSCLENRQGRISGWANSVFTVESLSVVEDGGASTNKPAWRAIRFIFDAKNPKAGIQEKELEM